MRIIEAELIRDATQRSTMERRDRRRRTPLAALAGCLLALVSGAQGARADAPDFARPGPELRAGVTLGFENSRTLELVNSVLLPQLNAILPTIPNLPPGTTVTSAEIDLSTMAGVSLAAGYRAHPRLGFEGAFEWARGDLELSLGLSAPSFGASSSTQPIGEWDLWAVSANVKAYALTGRVQPYALFGLGVMGQELADTVGAGLAASLTAFLPRFGGGADVYLTEHLLLDANVQYLLGTGDLDGEDLILLRLALGYRF